MFGTLAFARVVTHFKNTSQRPRGTRHINVPNQMQKTDQNSEEDKTAFDQCEKNAQVATTSAKPRAAHLRLATVPAKSTQNPSTSALGDTAKSTEI